MKIHFSGIGGIGMSALAQFCIRRGDTVVGSDVSESPIIDFLRKEGVNVMLPQEGKNLTNDVELLVYSEAVPAENPERVKATTLGIPQKSYFQYLGEISKDFRTIVVAGTHGKTTTTALIAAGFQSTGFGATVIVGAQLREFGGLNFHAGENEWLLVEGCEYRNNFQYLQPEILVLTNVELDHVDSYPSEEEYVIAFQALAQKAKVVLYHQGDEKAEEALIGFTGQKIAIGKGENVQLRLLGAHNKQNAALALAVGEYLHLGMGGFQQALVNFGGAARRQEYLGTRNGLYVYSDYAHHPTEILATLTAFRQAAKGKSIAVVFEPHQYSRTRYFLDAFAASFDTADYVAIYPIYEARDTEEDKEAGYIYVLKSLSTDHRICSIPNLFKIGYSKTDVNDRIKNSFAQ